MGFGNLAREYKTDTAPLGFCGVEGDEYVARIHESGAAIFNRQDDIFFSQFPGDDDLSF